MELLINLLTEWEMHMPLPKGIPILQHMVTKKYLRTDNVFCTENLRPLVTICNTVPELCPTKTDHIPIAMILELTQSRNKPNWYWDFRLVKWTSFNKHLEGHLNRATPKQPISMEEKLNTTVTELTGII